MSTPTSESKNVFLDANESSYGAGIKHFLTVWDDYLDRASLRIHAQRVQTTVKVSAALAVRHLLSYRHTSRRRAIFGVSVILALVATVLLLKPSVGSTPLPFVTPAPPPPFFCSTWDSANPIPEELRSKLHAEYRFWARYNDNDTFKLVPEQRPAVTETDTEDELFPKLHRRDTESEATPEAQAPKWKKPSGVKVIAMIFFGRPHQVDLLDCYLQQNMVQQGGYLDEVHFIEHTTVMADIAWLHNLVSATPGYKSLEVAPHCRQDPNADDCRYERIWEHFATEDDTIYIKIDDDIVYIHEETIPRLVHRRLEFEQPFAISANIVNSPITASMHYRTGAIYPYLPEPVPVPRASGNPPTWRASELPIHPDNDAYTNLAFGPTAGFEQIGSAIDDDDMLRKIFDGVPYPGHRWLPLTQNTTSLLYTPMSRITPDPWGPGVSHWALAAQQHYSLLQNIENKTIHRYFMASVPPHGEGLYNPQYTRYNLNFIAVWGKDVVKGANVHRKVVTDPNGVQKTIILSNMRDDEKNITADMPRALGRPMVIDVQAVVAHMHFHSQEQFIQMTDLLDRWRAYVNEKVCAANRQKTVPGQYDGLGYTHLNKGQGRYQCPWITTDTTAATSSRDFSDPGPTPG